MGYVNSNPADDDGFFTHETVPDTFESGATEECQRWNAIVAKLYVQLDSVKEDYVELSVMYQTALETIMGQARDIRALKCDIEALSTILATNGI